MAVLLEVLKVAWKAVKKAQSMVAQKAESTVVLLESMKVVQKAAKKAGSMVA